MSYCVNCGVELDQSAKKCVLCDTPVINPKEPYDHNIKTPYPKDSGQVDTVRKKDFAIFLSVILIATSGTCGLLNVFVFQTSAWSLFIIGICIMIWVFFIPAIIYTKISPYASALADGAVVGIYLCMVAYVTPQTEWLYALGLPIVAVLTLLLEVFIFLLKHIRVSFIATTLYIFAELAIFCVCLELLIDRFLEQALSLSWSAVVLTVCTIIIIALVTILSQKRMRNAVRRRFHF